MEEMEEVEKSARDVEDIITKSELTQVIFSVPNIAARKGRRSSKTEKTDEMDGEPLSGTTAGINIAIAIYWDDVETLKQHIMADAESKSNMCKRILEAVEFNSLRCLEQLLKIYDDLLSKLPPESTEEMILPVFDIELRHRRYGLNWPADDLPKGTPLHLIASRRSALRAMKLVANNPNVMKQLANKPDSEGSTPLLIATKANNVKVAICLMENIKDKHVIVQKNSRKESPIYFAALNGETDVIKVMLNRYQSSEERRKILDNTHDLYNSHSILYPASQSGYPDLLDVLAVEKDLLSLLEIEKNLKSWGAFVCNVCDSGCEKLLKKILEVKDPLSMEKCKDRNGATPLMRAAVANDGLNQLEIVKLLLKHESGPGAISAFDNQGRNVFHYAVKFSDVLQFLLTELKKSQYETRAEIINKKANDRSTPLQLAAKMGYVDSFKILLGYIQSETAHLDLFSRPFVGYTNLNILKQILEDWEIRDSKEVKAFLSGEQHYQPLLQVTAKGDIEMIQFMLDKGADLEQIGVGDSTALHYAVVGGKISIVEFFINKFPDMIDYTTDCGKTAAACAAEMGNVEILKLLLSRGAKLKSNGKHRTNILDCVYGDLKRAECAVMEIINVCTRGKQLNLLKELMQDSHFGADRFTAKMVEDIPGTAVAMFDKCVQKKTDKRNISYSETKAETKVTYYFFPFERKEKNGSLQAIESMVKHRRDECLGHPVVVKFLNRKLSSPIFLALFMFNFVMYNLFLLSLTAHAGMQTQGTYNMKSRGVAALSILILIVCLLNITKEVMQVKFNRWNYFFEINNYIEWTMYICAIVYVIPSGDEKSNLQISAGSIAVLLGWLNFTWLLRISGRVGIYVIMAEKVFLSVFKMLPIVFLFIIGFSIAFSLLMSAAQGFTTIHISFLTTFVMMTGEMDYRDIFLGNGANSTHALQKLILIAFLVLVTISIMNLLTGLAVDDTNEIMKRSKQEERLYKASLLTTLEHTLQNFSYLLDHRPSAQESEEILEDFPDKKMDRPLPWLPRPWELAQIEDVPLEEVEARLKTESNATQH